MIVVPLTYENLATATATGSQTTITFNSISGSFTDLVLVIAGNTANLTTGIIFNNDTTSLYSRTGLRGDGTNATSFRQTPQINIAFDGSVSQPGQNFIAHIMNYSNSTTNKTVLARSNNASAGIDQIVGLWRSTSAITRIDVISIGLTTNFSSGTTFTLYGIKAA